MIAMANPNHEPPIIERQSLCLSTSEPGGTIHAGEVGFQSQVDRHFLKSENITAERLINFKTELRTLNTEAFWARLMEGLADMCQAQFAFVSKRILVDDHDAPVEMPPIGEVGSCLMGVALYWNNGAGVKNLTRDYKYYAWGAPCSYMRHDKVFLCPSGLSELTADNPNQLPFACDAYLGVPLFADGKCFAHFGMMWTKEGLDKKELTWGYLEMVCHSLEDIIAERLLQGRGFAKSNTKGRRIETPENAGKVIPMESVTASQSLKPYARSLSHELRTPMQGVVGMLDVMYATVQEQIESTNNIATRKVFLSLKDNIETVQDSSKRAMEAADNVVHAYDLNMQIPETPLHDLESPAHVTSYFESRPKMTEGSSIVNPNKRRRSSPNAWAFGNPTKIRHIDKSETPKSPLARHHFAKPPSPPRQTPNHTPEEPYLTKGDLLTPADMDMLPTPGLRQSNIRDLIPVVIHDSLRVGGRPDSAISEAIPLGERIEVRSRSSNGHASQKTIEWRVDEDVPDVVPIDERDLSKLITQVFLNANKYTEVGTINIHARISFSKRYVTINITDTGLGIPEDFQPELFKAFAKEDHSLTRSKEGLGLGLLVAKGVARRVGGDIILIRSTTQGPNRGSEFEIRIPLDQNDRASRGNTPLRITPESVAVSKAPSATPNVNTPAARDVSPSPHASPTPIHARRITSSNTPFVPTISKLLSAAGHVVNSSTPPPPSSIPNHLTKPVARRTISTPITKRDATYDRELAKKYPLTFLVAEDNKINRKLLVNMLSKFGYRDVYEAFDGKEAVRIMESLSKNQCPKRTNSNDVVKAIDVILMDLWMPEMDGYEATEKILAMFDEMKFDGANGSSCGHARPPTILAVSADVTEAAIDRAARTGMQGYMTKPYMLTDLQRLIMEFCEKSQQPAALATAPLLQVAQ